MRWSRDATQQHATGYLFRNKENWVRTIIWHFNPNLADAEMCDYSFRRRRRAGSCEAHGRVSQVALIKLNIGFILLLSHRMKRNARLNRGAESVTRRSVGMRGAGAVVVLHHPKVAYTRSITLPYMTHPSHIFISMIICTYLAQSFPSLC